MEKLDLACYMNRVDNPNAIWNTQNVLLMLLPSLIIQILLVVFTTRLIYHLLRPFHQPHFVAEFLAGFILNIPVNGKETLFGKIFIVNGLLHFETMAAIGLIYYVFLTGVEMNLDSILQARKKATSIAVAGTFIPLTLGAGLYRYAQLYHDQDDHGLGFYPFNKINAYLLWGLALSTTSFPVVAHILADLKILYTGLGKLALTAATINDFYSWALFVLLVPFAINGSMGAYTVIGTLIFSTFCFCVLRPTLTSILVKKTNQNEWDNYQLSFVFMGVFACATVTEVLGSHSVVGALLFGLILPRGDFTNMLIEKADDIGSGYLAPLFFASIGMRANIFVHFHSNNSTNLYHIAMIVSSLVLLVSLKIVSTIIVTLFFYGMSIQDSLALGVLMNTKGILPLIVLNIAWDRKVLSAATFTNIVVGIFLMTVIVSPIINLMYKPRKRYEQIKQRTIENLKVDSEIKVMTCVHNARQATGMIGILEACSGMNVSPLRVFGVQLVELKERATALLFDHMQNLSSHHSVHHALDQPETESESIASVFEEYALNHEHAKVDCMVAMSAYNTIHKDIFNLALERQASLILLPFHKHIGSEDTLEITNPTFKYINQNVMQDAPCSVGIFVDRSHGHGALLTKATLRILMIFIGGPDDREALAIAWRMAKQRRTQLAMVRILLQGNVERVLSSSYDDDQGLLTAVLDSRKQKELDEEYVDTFRLMAVNDEDFIYYAEREVHSSDAIPELLNQLDKGSFDLYIIGQGNGRDSLVLDNMLEWTDCPELGVIGDILASNSFGTSSSILVVQQYGFRGMKFKNTHPSMKGRSKEEDVESLSATKE